MINIQNLSKKYGKNEVLKDISLDFENGEVISVLGPNASGKTTMIKCILGLVIPNRGKINVNGQDIARHHSYRDDIGYMAQIARFPDNLRVKELINMIKDIRNKPANDLALIELFKLQDALPKKLKTLSGGTRQKVNAVVSLMFDTPILILDEPTVGFDPIARLRFKQYIKDQRDKTIIITTHIISVVEELADKIVYILEGRVYFYGTPNELKEKMQEQNLEKALARMTEESEHGTYA